MNRGVSLLRRVDSGELESFFLFAGQGGGELLFYLLPEIGSGIVSAEGVKAPIRACVVDDASFHPLHIVVVNIHKMHPAHH